MPPSPSFSQDTFLNKLSHVQEGIQPSEQDAVAYHVYKHQDSSRPQLQQTDGGVHQGSLNRVQRESAIANEQAAGIPKEVSTEQEPTGHANAAGGIKIKVQCIKEEAGAVSSKPVKKRAKKCRHLLQQVKEKGQDMDFRGKSNVWSRSLFSAWAVGFWFFGRLGGRLYRER